MRIASYNVNGIRAASNKGLIDYLKEENFDVVCFQELKAMPEQIDEGAFSELGYHLYWYSAEKKGYSGVGIISKEEPDAVHCGVGHELFDAEGRVIRLDYEWGSVISAYFPSGTTGDIRQSVKMEFLEYFFDYIEELKQEIPHLVVCGDYNICHQAIDIHNPKGNEKTSGFLPEEREWMTQWFDSGFIDSFRKLNPQPDQYTWWSYRANARVNNKGWRIDYISVDESLEENLKASGIHNHAVHSDHCPSWVELSV